MSLDVTLAMIRSSAWASVLIPLTGESWSDPVIGLIDLLSVTVLALLGRFGVGSTGSSSSVTGEKGGESGSLFYLWYSADGAGNLV